MQAFYAEYAAQHVSRLLYPPNPIEPTTGGLVGIRGGDGVRLGGNHHQRQPVGQQDIVQALKRIDTARFRGPLHLEAGW